MESKKGIQLNQAFGAVLTLILVAVLVIVAIFIFVSLTTSFTGTTDTVTVTNETLTPIDAGTAVSNSTRCGFTNFAVTQVLNNSESRVINSPNYTTTAAGLVVNLTSEFIDADWNVSYTYKWGSEACTSSEAMITEFSNYTALIGLLGTIIFLGLVIGVLVASFAFGGKRV